MTTEQLHRALRNCWLTGNEQGAFLLNTLAVEELSALIKLNYIRRVNVVFGALTFAGKERIKKLFGSKEDELERERAAFLSSIDGPKK